MDNNNSDPDGIFRPPADDPSATLGAAAEFSVVPPGPVEPQAPPAVTPGPTPPMPPLFPYRATGPTESPGKRRPGSMGVLLLTTIVAGLIGAGLLTTVLFFAGIFDKPIVTPTEANRSVVVRELITPSGDIISAAAVGRKVVPSVVTVDVGKDNGGVFELFGSGSGVVLTADGLIVTNDHVIENAQRTQVVFEDGRIYEAEVVGSDRSTDLAVLRINATDLVPIEIGSTLQASIGDPAIAVGSPLGLEGGPSLTVGVLSAFGRQVQTGPNPATDTLFGMLQTDAPITQGSSGGALVDGDGALIGITSAIGVSSAGAEGIGFAIPIELVTRITDELIQTGTVHHAFLGIQLDIAFDDNPDGSRVPAGALVSGFAGDPSAAQAAGIEIGDLIVGYDGNPVATRDDLISGLRRMRVGDTTKIAIIRNGTRLTVDVTLNERPEGL